MDRLITTGTTMSEDKPVVYPQAQRGYIAAQLRRIAHRIETCHTHPMMCNLEYDCPVKVAGGVAWGGDEKVKFTLFIDRTGDTAPPPNPLEPLEEDESFVPITPKEIQECLDEGRKEADALEKTFGQCSIPRGLRFTKS